MRKTWIVFFICIISFTLCSCDNIRVAVLSARATFARNNADFDAAEKIYKEIIAIQPHVAEHYWELGTLYVGRRDKARALKQLEKLKQLGREDLVETLQAFIDL